MDCTEPFSPCKGLSAVSFVNGCWLVSTNSFVKEIAYCRRSKEDFIWKINLKRGNISN